MSKAASALPPDSWGFSLKGKRVTYHVPVELEDPPPFIRYVMTSGVGTFDIIHGSRDSHLIVRSDQNAIVWFREDWLPDLHESDAGDLEIDLRPAT